MNTTFLFQVEESRVLTGLGVLLLPASMSEILASLALHTSLSVRLIQPGKQEISATASVEEITRVGEPAMRVLLLTQEGATAVPIGTEVWVVPVT
ncbi:hypothetical protein [Hymenobacter rubripertinctus]|uniref:Uncharacterized protein n=1 Tax=Hymenobacter rubripertinctus TaxID=2029981 RepID=A0A418QKS3_9BACT|nr:hypothetical protein [Hymenobacter rubripertinctus]RIY05728.1 hypothetical protein D0T11_19895 [Hymenobacter rubripertinctus]